MNARLPCVVLRRCGGDVHGPRSLLRRSIPVNHNHNERDLRPTTTVPCSGESTATATEESDEREQARGARGGAPEVVLAGVRAGTGAVLFAVAGHEKLY